MHLKGKKTCNTEGTPYRPQPQWSLARWGLKCNATRNLGVPKLRDVLSVVNSTTTSEHPNKKQLGIKLPVGISSPGMTSSEMPSIIFTMARMELPCAATKTVFPAWHWTPSFGWIPTCDSQTRTKTFGAMNSKTNAR